MKPGKPLKRTELKRKTPLINRTPMPRGSSSLRRSGPPSPVSAKRKRENRTRTEVLRPLRAEQSWCSRCGVTGVGLDAHELLSRARGGSVTDLDNIVLLCRDDHRWITEHPTEAEAEGWALKRSAA